MDRWVARFLAAIGVSHCKAEDDVSYDPALDEDAPGSDLASSGNRRKGRHARRLLSAARDRLALADIVRRVGRAASETGSGSQKASTR